MELPPSLIQAAIPSTFSAPTLIRRVLHSTDASTVTSITIQTIPLYVSTLLGSTIQTDTVYGSTLTSNNIWIDTILASSIIGSTIQTDTSLVSSLSCSTIRANTTYVSSATGLTIQTNTCDISTVSGSTIQSNTLITSTVIGNRIQSNTLRTSTLRTSTIQSNIIRVSILLGSTIQTNTIKVSTIVGSTIQNNELNTNITIGSTLFANIFRPSTLQVSTLSGSTIQTTTANMSTLQLAGSTFQTNNFNFNTITGSTIQAHTVNISTLLGSTLIGCTIQVNAVNCSTILGSSTIQGNQINLSTLIGSSSQTQQGVVSIIQCSTLIGSTIQTTQFNGSSITASTIQNNIIQMSSLIGSTIQISTLYIASLIGSTIQTSTLGVSTLSGSTIQTSTLQVSTLSGSTIIAVRLNISTLVCSTLETNQLDGSTILYSSIQTNALSMNTIIGSTILYSSIQTSTFIMSTIIGSTIIGNFFNTNQLLVVDENKALSTFATNIAQLQYITTLTSQAGGIRQANTWSSIQTFSVPPIFNGLVTGVPSFILGMNASNQLIRSEITNAIDGTLIANYIPYANTISSFSTSNIYRVSATDIAIGQITSAFPTVLSNILSVAGLTQTTNLTVTSGTFSKIFMADRRWGLNGAVISGNNGCNFYMGTMNNNSSGNFTDTLYLNSWGDGSAGNVNAVMFNKTGIGMRIYQGGVGAASNFTVYRDALMTDVNSRNITLGQGSDTDGITFGPNAMWSSQSPYLRIGSGRDRSGTGVAQIISTNGNLHLDCASNNKALYLNYYVNGRAAGIYSYTPWTHTGSLTATGYIDVAQYIESNDWYYITSDKGMYWLSYSRGFVPAESVNCLYGSFSTHDTARNSWSGWGLGSKVTLMTEGNTVLIHDNTHGWVIWAPPQNDPWNNRHLFLGGGSVLCSQYWDRFIVNFNGSNTNNGYFYINKGGGYGIISDKRIKKNIKPIDTEQSIAFIRGITPSYFCFKNTPIPQRDANGKETGQMYGVDTCEQSGFIAQNVLASARSAGLPNSTVSNVYDYEQELSLPDEKRKTLLGLSDTPFLSHSYNALKGTIKKQDSQQTQINEIQSKCSMIDTGLTTLQDTVRQNAELLQQLIAKS